MNLYFAALMDAPSLLPGRCAVCGDARVTKHHAVPRSQGGTNGPQLHLCGSGTTGCHGKAEDKRLHFRYEGAWQYLETLPMKYEKALEAQGWQDCP